MTYGVPVTTAPPSVSTRRTLSKVTSAPGSASSSIDDHHRSRLHFLLPAARFNNGEHVQNLPAIGADPVRPVAPQGRT